MSAPVSPAYSNLRRTRRAAPAIAARDAATGARRAPAERRPREGTSEPPAPAAARWPSVAAAGLLTTGGARSARVAVADWGRVAAARVLGAGAGRGRATAGARDGGVG